MSTLHFDQFTYGVEEEFLWLNQFGKTSQSPPFDEWEGRYKNFTIGREAHTAVVEAISPICHSLKEVAVHIRKSREWLETEAKANDAMVYSGGTHPDIDWFHEEMTPIPYHQSILEDFGSVVKSNFIFGQHIHIGSIPEEYKLETFNTLRNYLSLLCAMASNSRYWRGEDTKIACFRQCIFAKMPRTGTPPKIIDLKELQYQTDILLKHGFIRTSNQFWYDARIHPLYGTIEIRVMDMQKNTDLAVGVALFTAILVSDLAQRKTLLPDWELQEWQININRWQAIKHGRDAKFIDQHNETHTFEKLYSRLLHSFSTRLKEIDERAHWALTELIQPSNLENEVRNVI